MGIDEGMVVTVEELGMRFVVVGIIGDYLESGAEREYYRIDSMKLIPFREHCKRDGSDEG